MSTFDGGMGAAVQKLKGEGEEAEEGRVGGSWVVFRRAKWGLEIAVVMGGGTEDVEMEGCERWGRGRAKVWRLSEGEGCGRVRHACGGV